MTMVISISIVFLIGLAAGSIINAYAQSVRNKPVLLNPLRCVRCRGMVRAADAIPVAGFFLQKGKCRLCRASISYRSPATEVLCGAVFVVLFVRFGWSAEFAAFSYLMMLLVAVVIVDIDHGIIPNEIVIAGMLGGAAVFAYNLYHSFGYFTDSAWWAPLAGMLPGTLFLFIVFAAGYVIYKSDNVMGMGDVKLFAPVGMFLGCRMCIIALILAILLGGIAGTVFMATGFKKRRDTIPFGPFIALGVFITIIWGYDILIWYAGK